MHCRQGIISVTIAHDVPEGLPVFNPSGGNS